MPQDWVFVTGASSGIGRAAVERLASDGWKTIAGVRRDGDQPATSTAHVLIDVADPTSLQVLTLFHRLEQQHRIKPYQRLPDGQRRPAA